MIRQIHFAILLVCVAPLASATDIRVRLWSQHPPGSITVQNVSGANIANCRRCAAPTIAATAVVKAANGRISIGDKVAAVALLTGTFDIVAGEEKARLKYPVQITNSRGALSIVAVMPLEDYVAAVLAGEAGGFKNAESLKAMAVAVRTYAIHFKGRHEAESFDACDSTHCQDLRLSFINGRMKAAADATAGELLWYNGETAATYYHSDCGGTTEQGGLLQHSANVAYLPVHADAYCIRNGGKTWRSEITRADLIRAARDAQLTQQTSVDDLSVIARTQSGRAKRVRLRGDSTVELPAEVFRLAVGRSLGWTKIRSDLYQVSRSGDRFVFAGRGAGHGVGLCQSGAEVMAAEGHNYREILAEYYPGTFVGTSASGLKWERLSDGNLTLESTRPTADRNILNDARAALRSAEQKLRWTLSGDITVRVFPTVASYRDSTGEPGWVAASTRSNVIRLQPSDALRKMTSPQDVLEHEFLHLLIESRNTARTPLWFREGLVLALSQNSAPAAERVSNQQLEAILRSPRSEAELRLAYRGAQARVAQLMRDHGKAEVLSWLAKGVPASVPGSR